jgi:hypothetical protein
MRERASQVDVAWSNWMQILRHHNYIRDVCIGPRQSLRKTKKNGQSHIYQGTHQCQLRPCELGRERTEEENASQLGESTTTRALFYHLGRVQVLHYWNPFDVRLFWCTHYAKVGAFFYFPAFSKGFVFVSYGSILFFNSVKFFFVVSSYFFSLRIFG